MASRRGKGKRSKRRQSKVDAGLTEAMAAEALLSSVLPWQLDTGRAFGMQQLAVLNLTGFSQPAADRYMKCHELIPEDLERWSDEQLRRLAQDIDAGSNQKSWERALTLLGHHKSLLASQLLLELVKRVPDELLSLWDLAYAESLGWLALSGAQAREQRGLEQTVAN